MNNLDAVIIEETIAYISSYSFKLPDSLSFFNPKIDEFLENFDLATLTQTTLSYAAFIGKK